MGRDFFPLNMMLRDQDYGYTEPSSDIVVILEKSRIV